MKTHGSRGIRATSKACKNSPALSTSSSIPTDAAISRHTRTNVHPAANNCGKVTAPSRFAKRAPSVFNTSGTCA